jgi:hypothetical protein
MRRAVLALIITSAAGAVEPAAGSRSFTWAYCTAAPILGSVRIADVSGDGYDDIVVATYGQGPNPYQEGYIHVIDRFGSALPGWPVQTPSCIPATAGVGDLDGDGTQEIVVGDWLSLSVYRSDGSVYPGWPKWLTTYQSCCLEDVDGDGDLEIIHPQDDRLSVYHHHGATLPGWPYQCPESVTAPSVADIDGDGAPEIVAGTYQGPTSPDPFEVYAWELDGTVMPGFPFATSGTVKSTPAVADLEGDGVAEIIVAAYDDSGLDYLYALDHQGVVKPGWPVRAGAIRLSSPAVGDLDGDGRLDVVIGGGGGSTVYAYASDASLLSGWPVVLGVGAQINSGPVVGDVDSLHPGPEVVVKTQNAFFALHGDGTAVPGFPLLLSDQAHSGTTSPSPALADVDKDGGLELIAAACFDSVALWDMAGAPSEPSWWPSYKRDRSNTGAFPFAPWPLRWIDIQATGFGARLSWPRPLLASSYDIYRGTDAFFPMDQGHLIAAGWTFSYFIDPGSCGDPLVNYFYAVMPRNPWGSGPCSDRVGEFDWAAAAAGD